MNKIYFFSALFSAGLGGFGARAQTDFRPGYIVRPAGDTVRGEIDYRDARFNTARCRFRPAAQGAGEVFQPAQLQGYGLREERKYYRSLSLPAADSAGGPAPVYFCEVLVNGPANLYFLRDAERVDRWFVATPALPLTELVHRKVRVERDGRVFMEEQNTFRATLAQALPGCAVAQGQVPTLSFTEGALKAIVTSYNRCQAPTSSPATAGGRARPRPQAGLLVGVEQTRFTLDGSNNPYDKRTLGPHTGLVAGVALGLPLDQFSRKLSLELALYYETQRYDQLFEGQPFPNYRPDRLFKFDLAYVRMPVLLRYTFPTGRLRPVVEAGPTLAYALKTTNTVAQTVSTGQLGPERPVFDSSGGFKRLEEGVCLGLGVQTEGWQKRRMVWVARYEWSTGCSGYSSVTTQVQRVYGLVTLDLFK